jgi:hypothetical protein
MARQEPSSSGTMKNPLHRAQFAADKLHQASLPPDQKGKESEPLISTGS